MKNLKKLATTLTLVGIIMIGVSSAKAGILLSDLTSGDSQQCTTEVKFDSGILMGDLVGIIMSDLVGIIMSDASENGCVQVNHGILIGD